MKIFLKTPKIIFTLFVLSFLFSAYRFDDDDDKLKLKMDLVISYLDRLHYDMPFFDDQYSKKVFYLYLKNIEDHTWIFTQEDSVRFSIYQDKLDDELFDREYNFYKAVNKTYDQQLNSLSAIAREYLSNTIDFSVNDSIRLFSTSKNYVKDKVALKEKWCKYLKYLVLEEIQLQLEEQDSTKRSFDTIERLAREKVLRENIDYFEGHKNRSTADRFALYINAVVAACDPHSYFLTPYQSENDKINFTGTLEGIGAKLDVDAGYIKVVYIVIGSPAHTDGRLEVGDIILKAGQGKNKPVDLYNVGIERALQEIRGRRGSKVVLTVRKASGIIKEITLVRDLIEDQETFVKSVILNDAESQLKIGYIELPSFYVDYDNWKNHSCARDIKNALTKLKSSMVNGIILDLRNNSGGSMREVVSIGGYFIGRGPIVQVKGKEGLPEVIEDPNPGVEYDGPLIVLVNENSASASELFAAAMQDYKRAVIIGSKSTFGKATMQKTYHNLVIEEQEEIGSLAITTHKFYRIDGRSTQLEGVVPDIILPDYTVYSTVGEKELDFPLPCDKTVPVKYELWSKAPSDLSGIVALSQARVDRSPAFQKRKKDAIVANNDEKYTFNSLKLELDKVHLSPVEMIVKDSIESKEQLSPFECSWPNIDIIASDDAVKITSQNEYVDGLKQDSYLHECFQVMKDILR